MTCAEQPALCASRVRDAQGDGQPIIEAWNGTNFERFVGRLAPPIALLMELMGMQEYVSGASDREHCTAWAESGGCETGRSQMQRSCDWACGSQEPRGWAEMDGAHAAAAAECEQVDELARQGMRPLPRGSWWAEVGARAVALGGVQLDADGFAYRLPNFVSEAQLAWLIVDGMLLLARYQIVVERGSGFIRNDYVKLSNTYFY